MACAISCSVSLVFVIAMIYFYNRTENSAIIQQYRASLSSDLKERYAKISEERKQISYQGYALGVLLSLGIIYYNNQIKQIKTLSLVCIVVATAFVTNYFYYILHPKSDWMLEHLKNQQETHAWLLMYREMQYSYHAGLVLGIVAVGVLAFAFRC